MPLLSDKVRMHNENMMIMHLHGDSYPLNVQSIIKESVSAHKVYLNVKVNQHVTAISFLRNQNLRGWLDGGGCIHKKSN